MYKDEAPVRSPINFLIIHQSNCSLLPSTQYIERKVNWVSTTSTPSIQTPTLFTTMTGVTHPFDPLSGDEITVAVEAVKQAYGDLFFQAVTLVEPRKAEMTNWLQNKTSAPRPNRIADVTAIDPAGKVYDGFVDLATKKIVKWEQLSGLQPIVSFGNLLSSLQQLTLLS